MRISLHSAFAATRWPFPATTAPARSRFVGEGRRVIGNIERVSNLFLTKTVYSVLLALLVVAAVALTLLVPRSHARPAPTPSTALTHSTLLPGSVTTQPTP